MTEQYDKSGKAHPTEVSMIDLICENRQKDSEIFDLKEQLQQPINMLLFCPHCGEQHIDEPQPEKNWTNPSHRSHQCQFCEWVWRPADVPTNGVLKIETEGQQDQSSRPRYFYTANDYESAVAQAVTAHDRFPKECPITRRKFFMAIEHPELGTVPTFGGPFDSYTIPAVDEDGALHCEQFDHDRGQWVDGGEPLGLYLTTEQPENSDLPGFLERAHKRNGV